MQEALRLEVIRKIRKIIDSKQYPLNDKKDIYILITNEFKKILDKNNGNSLCKHDIWLYNGYIKNTSEKRYKCLECGKSIKVQNWLEFEGENCILKQDYPQKIEHYIKLYYMLLFRFNTKEAQQKVITEFYRLNSGNQRKRK